MNYFTLLLVSIPGILVATTAHEFTRALVSTSLGDNLPKSKGRLTLNPFKHFEPIGFLLMFYSGGFGWGKPVETSALYYKNRKTGALMVGILPSLVNLLLGVIFLFCHEKLVMGNATVALLLNYLCYYNVALALYNLLPVTPMDCVKVMAVVMPANKYFKYLQYEKMVQLIFLFLLFFGVFGGLFDGIISMVINFLGKAFFIM